MTDCDYCGESFASDSAYDKHLKKEHFDELGPIDKRRLGGAESDDDDGIGAAPIALGGVILAAVAIVAYVVFVAGGGPNIGAPGSAHYHGPISMTVDGERVDFGQEKYQFTDRRFHFENPGMDPPYTWHAHATGVTLDYGMEAIGIPVTDNSVTFQNTTYTDGENAQVSVQVNGNDVTPSSYVLKEGDSIEIVVQTT
ncbi:C2H2-type zinc finger protein [Halorarius litoreus]|uniref:C2H2-type zinc finger protein n=1 Tax=Halorarius litoreus TaxID=2962676 RepID=UPI0020CCC12D|nr:hypothetical protein [Halorarius litoreus]